jgi:hypothetical protein
MTLLALVYVVLLGGRAITLIAEFAPIPTTMGVAMLAFPLVAIWAIFREIQFGMQSERLTSKALEIGLPELELELRPSGRATKESAQQAFESLKQEFDETNWTSWYLLAEAYEASGDRKRARHSMRQAILRANHTESSK